MRSGALESGIMIQVVGMSEGWVIRNRKIISICSHELWEAAALYAAAGLLGCIWGCEVPGCGRGSLSDYGTEDAACNTVE